MREEGSANSSLLFLLERNTLEYVACNVVQKKQSLARSSYFERFTDYFFLFITFSDSRKFYRHEGSVKTWELGLRERMSP